MERGSHGRLALTPSSRAVGTARLPVSGAAAACPAGRACSAAAGAAPQPVAPGPFPAACRGSPSWRPPKRRERPARGWAPAPGAAGRTAPPQARGGTSPAPADGTAWLGTGRHGVVGFSFDGPGAAERGLVRLGDVQCHMPPSSMAWLAQRGAARCWQHREPGHGGAVCLPLPSPGCRLGCSHQMDLPPQCHPGALVSPSSTGVTQQHHRDGWALPMAGHGVAGPVAALSCMPLLPIPCLQVRRAAGSFFLRAPSPTCTSSMGMCGSPVQHHGDPGCHCQQCRVYS